MHKPPAVDYPVGRSRFQNFLLLALWLGVAGVDALWFFQADRFDWRNWLGVALTLAAALIALRIWRVSPVGALHWDGQAWWWDSGGIRAGGVVSPDLDLQSVLLLGFKAHSGARHWFWLERGAAPARWSALRRAVHAPQPIGAEARLDDGALAVQPAHRGENARP